MKSINTTISIGAVKVLMVIHFYKLATQTIFNIAFT